MTRTLTTSLAALSIASACSDDSNALSSRSDAAVHSDAGSLDAGALDAAIRDGGAPLDAATLLDATVSSWDTSPDGAIPGTLEYSLSLLSPDMKLVIDALTGLNGKPIETLTPAEARMQPTVADAVKAVLMNQGKSTAPETIASATDSTFAGPAGALPIRVYKPAGAATGALPLIVYYHGGGWVIATIDTYDASARALANATGALVVSVEYRKAPEAKFPAAHDDAYAAYLWTVQNAATLGGLPTKVAVAGESAGGNLAAAVALRARDEGAQLPVHALLVYPVASSSLSSLSDLEHAHARPLDTAMIQWFTEQYFRTMADGSDPRISLVDAALGGLPPTTIISAQIDPLRSDGEQLAAKLQAAGVDVVQQTYAGVTHEFFGTGAVTSEGRNAVTVAAARLKTSLAP